MLTRLVLIRHGITRWNLQRRYCGHNDIPLSWEGKKQARKLRQDLKGVKFDRIYSSVKSRAFQSCRIIFPGSKFTKVRALQEINFGVLEGLYHEVIMKRYGGLYRKWIKDPYNTHIPGLERMQDFKKRVNTAIKNILRLNTGKTIAVVCHGGVIGIILSSILKSRDFWRYVPAAGTISVVDYKNGKAAIIQFNKTKIQGRFSTQS